MAEAKPMVPGWYWAVAIIALLWEAMGCYAYVMHVTMDAAGMAALPAAEREIRMAMPVWATGAYAVAVWAGLVGAIGLLLRARWARIVFLLSLIGVIVQFGWAFLMTPIMTTMGPSAAAFPAFIILMAALLLWFADWATKRGWLN